jgi:hypothetical protein
MESETHAPKSAKRRPLKDGWDRASTGTKGDRHGRSPSRGVSPREVTVG